MRLLVEDSWISDQATSYSLSELEDCAIAIDASYWLCQVLESDDANEPLLPALGGLTGIERHIDEIIGQFLEHKITPFFIFDGQALTGQDTVTLRRGIEANSRTDEAWVQYARGEAEQAVKTFGSSPGAYRVQNLYPLLQELLRRRGLHFLVAPYNASAQLAYFEMIDSDQCGGIMGSQELLAYPINDSVIRAFDFKAKTVTATSKKRIMRSLGVSEFMFIDALLMTGTTFLSPFPPLQEKSMYANPTTVMDAVNLLRTSDKSVTTACASFNDILQSRDRDWLDKYRKARLVIQHFIYIAESGEIRVNDYEHLTQDNHEYLGLQLPAELFHYLNTGLIGSRLLSSITHGQIMIQPTLDGTSTEEYRKLITQDIVSIKEQALALIIPRIHRGIAHKAITMRVWFDPNFSYTMAHASLSPPPSQKVSSWDVKEEDLRSFFPPNFAAPIAMEVMALANDEFLSKTVSKERSIKGIDSTEMVASVTIWRFLHLRGYVNDSHALTSWGNALAMTFFAIGEITENRPTVRGLEEAALLAFELIRLGVLGAPKTQVAEGYPGYPRKGSSGEKASLALISECASLLKLRHQDYGYTGPLNKGLLMFRSQSAAVRDADRDLIEAIVASMFLYGQSMRERDDYVEISQTLPFTKESDIGLGVAVRTFFDEDKPDDGKEARAARLQEFPQTYLPYAEDVRDDFLVSAAFVGALNKGVQTLKDHGLSSAQVEVWAKAQAYLDARPF